MESRAFDVASASEAEFAAITAFSNLLRAERLPEDPPRSLEYTINNLRSIDLLDNYDVELRYVWRSGEIIASLVTEVAYEESNRHLMRVDLNVHPDYRRQGLATSLLRNIVQVAGHHGRQLVMFETNERVPAGAAFAGRLGATEAYKAHINQLELGSLNHGLLTSWVAGAKREEYDLELWVGAIPEDEIEAVAHLMRVMNTAPTEDLDIEPTEYTPEMIRQWEAYAEGRKIESWTYCVRHKGSGDLAGFTQVHWDPENPETLQQGDTGVLTEHRGKGLGKWLKAQMLLEVLRERPFVKRVRTGNADANAPMLAINQRLGFGPFIASSAWQVDIGNLEAYLASAPAAGREV